MKRPERFEDCPPVYLNKKTVAFWRVEIEMSESAREFQPDRSIEALHYESAQAAADAALAWAAKNLKYEVEWASSFDPLSETGRAGMLCPKLWYMRVSEYKAGIFDDLPESERPSLAQLEAQESALLEQGRVYLRILAKFEKRKVNDFRQLTENFQISESEGGYRLLSSFEFSTKRSYYKLKRTSTYRALNRQFEKFGEAVDIAFELEALSQALEREEFRSFLEKLHRPSPLGLISRFFSREKK